MSEMEAHIKAWAAPSGGGYELNTQIVHLPCPLPQCQLQCPSTSSKYTAAHLLGRSLRLRMWSLVPVSSLPSMGGTVGMPPVATRMCSACISSRRAVSATKSSTGWQTGQGCGVSKEVSVCSCSLQAPRRDRMCRPAVAGAAVSADNSCMPTSCAEMWRASSPMACTAIKSQRQYRAALSLQE